MSTTKTNTPKVPHIRLTIEMRTAIARKVLADMPALDPKHIKDLQDKMSKRAREIAVEQLPEKVRAVWTDPTLQMYVHTEYVHVCCMGYSLPVSKEQEYRRDTRLGRIIEADPEWIAAHTAHDKLRDDTRRIQEQLSLNLALPKTVREFIEMFPDLAKYAPEESRPVAQLPATTALMDTLKAAGLKVGEEEA